QLKRLLFCTCARWVENHGVIGQQFLWHKRTTEQVATFDRNRLQSLHMAHATVESRKGQRVVFNGMNSTFFCNPQRKCAETAEEICNAFCFAKVRKDERNHCFLGIVRYLKEAAGRNRNRHLAEMAERLLRLDNDFAFMRKARKALFQDRRGQRAPWLI